MASSKFNRAQVGLQTAIGTGLAATAMTINVPWRGTYEDKRQIHVADWDAGTWTPTTRVALAGTETAATFEGTAFFEMMPVLLNSGFADVAPTDTYLHTYTVSPAAIGVPMPLTAMFGTVGMTGLAAAPFVTGPAVLLKDLFLKTLTLSANINDKIVKVKGEFFGSTFDSNTADAGYVFDTDMTTQPTMTEINGLRGVLRYQDVHATDGGGFLTMADFECSIIDWELVIDTGIEPAYCLTDETTTWTALKYTQPSCTFKPIVRTSSVTYAAIKRTSDARTYQELQLYIPGAVPGTHYLHIDMTGRWDVVPTAHDEQDGEVVIKPTFLVETPYFHTTTPHWLTIYNLSTHNWT